MIAASHFQLFDKVVKEKANLIYYSKFQITTLVREPLGAPVEFALLLHNLNSLERILFLIHKL